MHNRGHISGTYNLQVLVEKHNTYTVPIVK